MDLETARASRGHFSSCFGRNPLFGRHGNVHLRPHISLLLHTGGHGRRKIRRSYVQATAAAACCSRRCRQLSSSRYLAARLQGTARAYGAARGALGANSPLSELQGPSSRCAQPNHSVLAAARRERPDRTARVPGAAPACARCRAGGRLTAVPSRRTTQ